MTLTEGTVLGGGAFSRVSIVTEETTGRQYALKRMRKSAVVQCPEHVFCEQTITRNTAHPFCIRQYGSFQVSSCLSNCLICGCTGCCVLLPASNSDSLEIWATVNINDFRVLLLLLYMLLVTVEPAVSWLVAQLQSSRQTLSCVSSARRISRRMLGAG